MDQAAVDEVGGSEPGAVAFVWGTWTVLAVGLFALVYLYGRNVPVWDDYDIIDVVLGRQSLSWEWLWSPHNEHRVVLPRALLLGLDRLTGHDVRAGMYTSAFVLSAAAAGLVFAMRRMRGGLLATDAFLPIVSLSIGQYTNLIWGWQVQFTVATALTLGLLALIAMQKGARLGKGRAVTAGILLAALPLCGASGLVIVPFGAAWLLLAAFSGSGKEAGRTGADQAVILLSSLPGLVITAMAILTYQPAAQHPPAEELGVVGKTFVQFISLGMGPASGSYWRLTGFSLLALGALGVAILWSAVIARPRERLRDAGLLLFLGATTALAIALALGRAGSGAEAGLEPRYVTLAVPPLCSLYMASAASVVRVLGRLIQMSLFLVACVLVWPNTETGIMKAREKAMILDNLELDVKSGAPLSLVIRGYGSTLHPSQDYLAEALPLLRKSEISPFGPLQDDPPTEVVELPVETRRLQLAKWQGDGSYELTGVDPFLTFRLPRPMVVFAIRINYDYQSKQADEIPARFVLTWLDPDDAEYYPANRYSNWTLPTGKNLTTTVRVAQPISEFQIQPDDRPGIFRINSLELIVPKRGTQADREVRSRRQRGQDNSAPPGTAQPPPAGH